jgi:DNA-binding NarL/FixJ family response regulator
MFIHIAVSDSIPALQRGIAAMLIQAGYRPDMPEDLLSWARQDERWVVVMGLRSAADWVLLEDVAKARPGVIVVAMLEETDIPMVTRAVAAGVAAVVPRDASPDTMRRALEAAIEGRILLPTNVVKTLASPAEPSHDQREGLSDREVEWLRALASGLTVGQLANQTGYSERAMFRLLRQLYARFGVSNRTEALIRAQEQGLL